MQFFDAFFLQPAIDFAATMVICQNLVNDSYLNIHGILTS